ncbi:MAG: hypothetical protein ACLRWP_03090 [Bilophila wadsworthia]
MNIAASARTLSLLAYRYARRKPSSQRIFPQADITHVSPEALSETITSTDPYDIYPKASEACGITNTFLMLALEQLDLRGYDLVISSDPPAGHHPGRHAAHLRAILPALL